MAVFFVLLFGQLPYIGGEHVSLHSSKKSNLMECRVNEPSSGFFEFYQPGDLVVGEMTSQSFFNRFSDKFRDRPSPTLSKELM